MATAVSAAGVSSTHAKPTPNGKKSSISVLPAILALVTAVAATLYLRPGQQKAFELKPCGLPKVTESTLFNASYNEAMYWGTYRPGFYAGIRPRSDVPLMAGLMWGSPYVKSAHVMRHEASKDHGLETFGWTKHDLRSYGEQHISDGPLAISMQWLKQPGRGYGGDWVLTLNVTRDDATATEELVPYQPLYLYLGQTSPDDTLTGASTFEAEHGVDVGELMNGGGAMFASGVHPEMGKWMSAVRVLKGDDGSDLHWGSVSMMSAKAAELHKMHDLVAQSMAKRHSLKASDDCDGCMMQEYPDGANAAVLQVNFRPPFSMDIAFASGLGTESARHSIARGAMQMSKLMGPKRQEMMDAKVSEYDRRFDEMANGTLDGQTTELCQNAFSEVLGSMGYFHGSSIVEMKDSLALSKPQPLFTAVPSRAVFPRGFLWDEGFHQLLVQQWDLQVSCDAIAHWLDLINMDGWIPREQILGDEARSRVPQAFLAQQPGVANPPTLLLPLMKLAQALNGSSGMAGLLQDPYAQTISRDCWIDFLQRAWPRLQLWLQWLEFQAGDEPTSYRWRGRTDTGRMLNPLTLASGLDDFPRASHPSNSERHIDLRSWMAVAYRSMIAIGDAIGRPDKEMATLQARGAKLMDYKELKRLHWDASTSAFLDWGKHTEDVVMRQAQLNQQSKPELVRMLEGAPPKEQFVPHIGYNSLFPLALELIPWDSPDVASQLALLSNPKQLWSPYGLRSLAKSSSMYHAYNDEDDAPYWRGNIWINLNYLVLGSLHTCLTQGGPHAKECQRIYSELRTNLLTNMWKQFDSPTNQFIWESYSDIDGSGQGTHPMGWSSMIALIALERF
eukprot:jgi/Ulvmu1/12016/UM083_0029.1